MGYSQTKAGFRCHGVCFVPTELNILSHLTSQSVEVVKIKESVVDIINGLYFFYF